MVLLLHKWSNVTPLIFCVTNSFWLFRVIRAELVTIPCKEGGSIINYLCRVSVVMRMTGPISRTRHKQIRLVHVLFKYKVFCVLLHALSVQYCFHIHDLL